MSFNHNSYPNQPQGIYGQFGYQQIISPTQSGGYNFTLNQQKYGQTQPSNFYNILIT